MISLITQSFILSVDLCTSEESWNCFCHSPFLSWNLIYGRQNANGKARQCFSFPALQLISLHPEAWNMIRPFETCCYWPLCYLTPFKFPEVRFGFERFYRNEFHVPSWHIIINDQMANFWFSRSTYSYKFIQLPLYVRV